MIRHSRGPAEAGHYIGWLALAILLAPAAAPAQQPADPPPWRAQLTGTVISADTGAPLAGATVDIRSTKLVSTAIPSLSKTATSDENELFEFTEMPAGEFSLRVSRPGYYYGGSRQFESDGALQHVSLRQRQTVALTLAMQRGGAITGRIVDEFGEPVAAVQVHALRYEYGADGGRAASPAGVGDLTDDLGQFRVYGLPPGDFVVVASGHSPASSAVLVANRSRFLMNFFNPAAAAESPPTYFPGTLSAGEAQLVSLGPGQEGSVQFALMPGRVVQVSGRAVMANGTAVPTAGIATIWPRTGTLATRTERIGADGTFVFPGVTPGDYWINVNNRAGRSGESASIPITVGTDDISGLSIVTRRGATIRGSVGFEGRWPGSTFVLSASFVDGRRDPYGPFGGGGFIHVNGDGRFETQDVIGHVTFSSMEDDWVVKSVTVGGRNVLDTGIDLAGKDAVDGIRIVVTNKLTSVSGRVADDRGQPLSEQLVVLLRLDGAPSGSPGVRALRTDMEGRFGAHKLRPGSYVAGVVEDLEPGYHLSPEFQERLRERGQRFTLGDGEAVRLELTLTPGLR